MAKGGGVFLVGIIGRQLERLKPDRQPSSDVIEIGEQHEYSQPVQAKRDQEGFA
jgi:hypothetical protein